MGVMKCHRADCKAILCDRLILENSHYICDDCYEELIKSREDWPGMMSVNEVREKIVEFLNSPKGSSMLLSYSEIDAEFKRLMGNP